MALAAAAIAVAASPLAAAQPEIGPDDPPTAANAAPLEVTVKFKDQADIAGVIKTFWTDPSSARNAFDRLKTGRPALSGATLDRVTYSDELVLHFACDAACAQRRPEEIRKLVVAVSAMPEVVYAEADMRVQTQTHRE